MESLEIQEVLRCLPHRYPFVMIDRVLSYESGKTLTAIKNVSVNEPYFTGHFPGTPIMPGVLIIESMAQACCILAVKTAEDKGDMPKGVYLFAAVDKVRFKRPVVPGDQLQLEATFVKNRSDIWKLACVATVDGELVCKAEITSARRDIEQ